MHKLQQRYFTRSLFTSQNTHLQWYILYRPRVFRITGWRCGYSTTDLQIAFGSPSPSRVHVEKTYHSATTLRRLPESSRGYLCHKTISRPAAPIWAFSLSTWPTFVPVRPSRFWLHSIQHPCLICFFRLALSLPNYGVSVSSAPVVDPFLSIVTPSTKQCPDTHTQCSSNT